jgi:hypothetical protein
MTKCHGFVPEGAEMGWAVAGALIAVTPPQMLTLPARRPTLRADPTGRFLERVHVCSNGRPTHLAA